MSLLDGEIVEESALVSILDDGSKFSTYRASASAYSREVLAAAFNTHIEDLPTPSDPLIVNRVNPVD